MSEKSGADLARVPVEAFRGSASAYYEDAEKYIDAQWETLIWPEIQNFDFDTTLDFAAGHGRNTAKLARISRRVYAVDANPEAAKVLRRRFDGINEGRCAVTVIQNNAMDLHEIESNSITALYSFDSMVHFEKRLVEMYMPEFFRVMAPRAYGFIHHSNFGRVSDDPDFKNHPAWRSNVDGDFFARCGFRNGLQTVRQKYLNWSGGEVMLERLDCLSILYKPTR